MSVCSDNSSVDMFSSDLGVWVRLELWLWRVSPSWALTLACESVLSSDLGVWLRRELRLGSVCPDMIGIECWQEYVSVCSENSSVDMFSCDLWVLHRLELRLVLILEIRLGRVTPSRAPTRALYRASGSRHDRYKVYGKSRCQSVRKTVLFICLALTWVYNPDFGVWVPTRDVLSMYNSTRQSIWRTVLMVFRGRTWYRTPKISKWIWFFRFVIYNVIIHTEGL